MMKVLFIVLVLNLPFAVLADQIGYEVELIVFEDLTGKYIASELWPENNVIDNNSIIKHDFDTSEGKEVNIYKHKKDHEPFLFELMELKESRLIEQVNKLREHPDYRVLVHKMWKQTGLDQDKAFPVRIDSRVTQEIISENNSEQANKSLGTLKSQVSEQNGANINSLSMLDHSSYIDGQVTLIMSRYLHLNTELNIHKEKAGYANTMYSNTLAEKVINYSQYHMNFERRMRSKEIHYIDHPLGGIIVLAIPFKIETKPDDISTTPNYKTL